MDLKSKFKIALLVGFMMPMLSLGQNFILKVKLKPNTIIPTNDFQIQYNQANNNYSLDSLFEPCYPNAQTPELLQYFNVVGQGNVDSAILHLQSSQLFEVVEQEEIYYVESCTNPFPPVDDTWIVQGSLNNDALSLMEANCAWSITTGDPSVLIGIADAEFEDTHEDLVDKISHIDGPISGGHQHGTLVAGAASAHTNNTKGIAAIGYNCQLSLERIQHNSNGSASSSYIRTAIWSLYQDGVPIINVSWTGTGLDLAAATEITDNGTTLVLAAGNTPTGNNHSNIANIPGVILVSGVTNEDKHGPTGHRHNQWVDLCALSKNVTTTKIGDTYTSLYGGTSLASPLVSGTIGLMRSINNCLTPEQIEMILKNTTDPIVDAADFPNGVGTGRVNAYKAVRAAEISASTTLDLYIKDRDSDFGEEITGPGTIQMPLDDGPDIWVRNQDDGLTNQFHEDPEYTFNQPVYVYVRVRNKSCVSSTGLEQLKLYWTKTGSGNGWPNNWNGTLPNVGGVVNTQVIPIIEAGKETILKFEWQVTNPYLLQDWGHCLLAEISGGDDDNLYPHPGNLAPYISHNNNVAGINVSIIDIIPNNPFPVINNVKYPHGQYINIGNSSNQSITNNLIFTCPTNYVGDPITTAAQVRIIFDTVGWNLIQAYVQNREDIRIVGNRELILLNDSVRIDNVTFSANTELKVYVGFSFLSDEITPKNTYKYHVYQEYTKDSITAALGVHFTVNKMPRNPFDADAGADKEIDKGESITLSAATIMEGAIYNWYNNEDSLIYSGTSLTVSPEITTQYRLEVIATLDGFKDLDAVEVAVSPYYLEQLSPNPVSSLLTVDYVVENANFAYLMLLNHTTSTPVNNYILSTNSNQSIINVSNLIAGYYSVVLVCDGKVYDVKNLIIQ